MFIGRAQSLLGITPNPPKQYLFIVIALIMLVTMIGYDQAQRNKKQ
jgi:hypothetical protein